MATITRFIIRIFLSPRALFPLSLVGIYRGPRRILLPASFPSTNGSSIFHLGLLSFTFRPPSPYRRVHIVALPVVSNRRFEFLNIFQLPAPLCPCDLFPCSTSRARFPFRPPNPLSSQTPRFTLLSTVPLPMERDCHRLFDARATGKRSNSSRRE